MSHLKLSELAQAATKKELWGMIIYNISDDGICLYGIWTNNDNPGRRMNEIARKKDERVKGVDGDYVASWIEPDGTTANVSLSISTEGNRIAFVWEEMGRICFKGAGMQLSDNQIAVIYWVP
jgi:hypothetical protein